VSNLKVVGDKITLTGTLSTDTYRKLGVAPIVITEEAVIVGGKIKSETMTVTPESLAKIQAAMAAQAKAATPAKKVLLILSTETSLDMELMLTKEVGVMVSMIEKAGYKVVVASVSGQPLVGSATTLKPDLKLADVKVEDYAGLILPCLASSAPVVVPDAAEIVKKAATLGKPIAAQNGSVILILAPAGLLNGKQFAVFPGYEKMVPAGIYKGAGVVQDGNVITSGSCPFAGRDGKYPDTTAELTQKFITMLASAR
jgi:4-methyl-5(b-hydroxyethyl)-thiazole monophosphate biosynthesis